MSTSVCVLVCLLHHSPNSTKTQEPKSNVIFLFLALLTPTHPLGLNTTHHPEGHGFCPGKSQSRKPGWGERRSMK